MEVSALFSGNNKLQQHQELLLKRSSAEATTSGLGAPPSSLLCYGPYR